MNWKRKIAESYISQRNRFNKGMSEVYNLKTIVQYFVYAEVLFKLVWKTKVSHALLGVGAIAIVGLAWLLGYWWDKFGMFVLESEWGNKRNWFVKQMRKKYNLPEDKE